MPTATSLRIPDETRIGFDELAQLSGRTRSKLMVEALDEYLAAKRRRIALIQEGERDLDEGRFENHETLVARFKERGMLAANYVPFAEHPRD